MRTIDDMIRQEVHYCVSGLVSTLAQGVADQSRLQNLQLRDLCYQASELAAPVDDWEEAAVQAGWTPPGAKSDSPYWQSGMRREKTAKDACERDKLDPYHREVFEHWLVSPWFAEKLISHGEKVDTDFAGMNVWARCTTGQAISQDGVVQRIYREVTQ